MLPGWVHSLDDYWRWIERLVDESGAYLNQIYLSVQLIEAGQGGPLLALNVEQHRLVYFNDSYLEFDLSVGADLEPIDYSFHYARADDSIIWRLDKHHGHETEDGADTHIHLPPNERREPHGTVDLGDVLDRIHKDQQDQWAR